MSWEEVWELLRNGDLRGTRERVLAKFVALNWADVCDLLRNGGLQGARERALARIAATSWENVRDLRRNGDLQGARELALAKLAADPNDFRTRTQLEWVTHDEIKASVAQIDAQLRNSQRPDHRILQFIWGRWEEYRLSDPRVPDMACSMIIQQITKIGHLLPGYADIIWWLRLDGLRDEDRQANEYEGRTYPSLAVKIALALCKWIKAHPDRANDDDFNMAFDWIDEARTGAPGDYPLWLDWNAAILLRHRCEFDRAAMALANVIRTKREQFWVWAEAARLYRKEQPDLALSCFCRAMECHAEPKFLVKTHRELAELLVELEDYAQASREIAIALEIREAHGWAPGRELEALIASAWYDPDAPSAETPEEFYERHSAAALQLCFDHVETREASYIGSLIPRRPDDAPANWRPRPLERFAIKDESGTAWSLAGHKIRGLDLELGQPVMLVIGRQDGEDRQTIVHIAPRPQGTRWDCLEPGSGVVVREANERGTLRLFVAGSGEEVNVADDIGGDFRVGDGVRFLIARNPRNDRMEAFHAERGELPDQDVRFIQGQIRRNPKGFAFVEDAFIAPPLAQSIDAAAIEVSAVAVFARHPEREGRSWKVISLSAID